MEKIELQSLIAGVSSALQMSQYLMEQEQLNSFLRFFEAEGESAIRPMTKDVLVSYSEAGIMKEAKFSVPTAALVSHNGLSIDKADVTLRVNISVEDQKLMAELGKTKEMEGDETDNQQQDAYCEMKITYVGKNVAGVDEVMSMLHKTI